jgi:fibronectin type 3 domain-containing protein
MSKKSFFIISIFGFIFMLSSFCFAQPTDTILVKITVKSDTTPPSAPTGLVATPGDAVADLSWNANTEPDLAGYNVYRSGTAGGPYTKINPTLLTQNSYQDTGLTNGTTYYYVVTAVDTSDNESEYSEEVFAALTIGPFTEAEPNDNFTSANVLAINSIVNGTINPAGDNDYYKIHVETMGRLYISMTNVPAEIMPRIHIYDSALLKPS